MTHPSVYATSADAAALPLIRLWMVRSLLDCNGVHKFLGDYSFTEAAVAALLGLLDDPEFASPSPQPDESDDEAVRHLNLIQVETRPTSGYSQRWAMSTLHRLAWIFDREVTRCPVDDALNKNVAAIAERLTLSETERDILHLLTLHQATPAFGDCLDLVGELTQNALCQVLATCLRRPLRDVQTALRPHGKLVRSALVVIDQSRAWRFTAKIEIPQGFSDLMLQPQDEVLDLLQACVVPGKGAGLRLSDYPHLATDLDILRSYLTEAMRQRRAGVNILIHGRPGTGKTELVRALADAVGEQLLEISVEAPNGEALAGRRRFDAYRCAQSLLAGSRHLLLFDEIEDVFHDVRSAGRERGNASGIKGWVNQWLETNPLPTFWITNDLDAVDPAYRRRFDYVLPMEVPPASVRRQMVDRYVGKLAVSESWKVQVADHSDLAPAMLARAAQMTAVVCAADTSHAAEIVMSQALNHSLRAMEAAPLAPQISGVTSALPYRLDFISTDFDLPALEAGLRRMGQGRLCLYGPPGTGKTAFGRHLAKALDRPLLVRRASDILSPYVGVAEKNISRMFAQAQEEGALLLFDEADSLLRDRKGAQRMWEVTQVNEMLTQMEGYEGIFIASTNLMDSLDEASLRRFDALIRLNYLKAGQAWELFTALSRDLELPEAPRLRCELDRLDRLTPGDFAAVQRLSRLQRPCDGSALLGRLRQLCDAKHDAPRRQIGFLAA